MIACIDLNNFINSIDSSKIKKVNSKEALIISLIISYMSHKPHGGALECFTRYRYTNVDMIPSFTLRTLYHHLS